MQSKTLKISTIAIFAAAFIFLAACSGSRKPPFPANVATLAGAGGEFGEPFGIAVRGADIYISDGDKGVIWRRSADGTLSIFAQGLDTPSALAFDKNGDLIVADSGTSTIRKVDAKGGVSTFAGAEREMGSTDGPALTARFNHPIGLAIDKDGRIFVADTYNDRIRVIENGTVRTLAGGAAGFADGVVAEFDTPTGIAFFNDQLLVADTGNSRLRIVSMDGSARTLAGGGTSTGNSLLLDAEFYSLNAVAVDPSGNIFVSDDGQIKIIGGIVASVKKLNDRDLGIKDGPIREARFGRISGLAFDDAGELLIADSDNRLLRIASARPEASRITAERAAKLYGTAAEFRAAAPGRWPYDPAEAKRDIAGTLGELRGDITGGGNDDVHFHNALDIAGSYGETARAVRSEKVLAPEATSNFGTLRELLRLPTMGYIHIRLGRRADGTSFGDPRFQFLSDATGKVDRVRIPRGVRFAAGDPIGTLNPMNHVHLIAGRRGFEMNALDALDLPGVSDTRPPVIDAAYFETPSGETISQPSRIALSGPVRVVMRAYDQVDGNAGRRRLGLYKAGYQLFNSAGEALGDVNWTIVFDRLPPSESVKFVYARGSHSGATGETIFNYIVTNRVEGDAFSEGFLDPRTLAAGSYTVKVFAADHSNNISTRELQFEVVK